MIVAGVPPRGSDRLELLVGRVVPDEPANRTRPSGVSWLKACVGKLLSAGTLRGEQMVKPWRLDGRRGGRRQYEKLRKAVAQS